MHCWHFSDKRQEKHTHGQGEQCGYGVQRGNKYIYLIQKRNHHQSHTMVDCLTAKGALEECAALLELGIVCW